MGGWGEWKNGKMVEETMLRLYGDQRDCLLIGSSSSFPVSCCPLSVARFPFPNSRLSSLVSRFVQIRVEM